MIEKIIKNIKELLLNRNYDIENIDNEIKELEEKVDELYYAMDYHMSPYKTELLYYKYNLLINKYNSFITKYPKRIRLGHTKKIMYSVIKNYIIVFITKLLMNNPISLVFSLLGLYVSVETLFNCIDSLKVTFNKSDMVKEHRNKIERMSITLNNCKNTLSNNLEKIINGLSEAEYIDKDSLDDITYANNIILGYIYTRELIIESSLIPEKVKKLIIGILQDDLKTNESSLEKLLEVAHKKVEEEKELTKNQTQKALKKDK